MRIYISNEISYLKEEFIKKRYEIAESPYKSDVILTNLKENHINNKFGNYNAIIIDSASRGVEDIENILIGYYGNIIN